MSDLNDRIAKAKGWHWEEHHPYVFGTRTYATWLSPGGYAAEPPDFVGTVRGLAGMLWDLGIEWQWGAHDLGFACFRGLHAGPNELFTSPRARPGDCVGAAWLSVFGKEAADAV